MSGVFSFGFSLVSCIVTILGFVESIKCLSSVILFLMPFMFNCIILKSLGLGAGVPWVVLLSDEIDEVDVGECDDIGEWDWGEEMDVRDEGVVLGELEVGEGVGEWDTGEGEEGWAEGVCEGGDLLLVEVRGLSVGDLSGGLRLSSSVVIVEVEEDEF